MPEPAFTSVHESNTGNKSTVHVAAEGLSYSYMYSVRRLCVAIVQVLAIIWLVCHVVDCGVYKKCHKI